jgi:hypothetical protein
MNRKLISTTRESLSRRKFLAAAAASPVAFAVGRAAAQDPVPQVVEPPAMGTIGIAAGQKLRVSVFDHADIPGTPCGFRIDVFGLGGQLLGQHTGEVLPGTGTFADFDVATQIRKPGRVQVHVMVTTFGDEPVEATAEVFDVRSGSTMIPDAPCITPVPLSRADASVGLIREQIMRVSVFHHPDANQIPCDLIVEFISLDGTVLAVSQGSVLPGKGLALDWGDGFQGFPALAMGERLQIHAHVQAGHPDMVGITGEVFDAKSGATAFVFIPCSG